MSILKGHSVPFDIADLVVKSGNEGEYADFEGMLAVYNNKDYAGHVIRKGTFKDAIAKRVKMFVDHGHTSDKMPGKWLSLKEDSHGLVAKGRLFLNLAIAKDAHFLMKEGQLDALSVGFKFAPKGAEWVDDKKGGFLEITKGLLFEGSIVPLGMNKDALITQVKSLYPEILETDNGYSKNSIRDFENLLREKGYSQRQARTISHNGFKSYLSEYDDEPVSKSSNDYDQVSESSVAVDLTAFDQLTDRIRGL